MSGVKRVVDPANGVVVTVSEALAESLGWEPAEVLDKPRRARSRKTSQPSTGPEAPAED